MLIRVWLLLLSLVPLSLCHEGVSLLEDLAVGESSIRGMLEELRVMPGQDRACAKAVIDADFLSELVKRGFFAILMDVLRACVESEEKLDPTLEAGLQKAVGEVRRKLSETTALLQQAKMHPVSVVSPAFEWAQSPDQVFIGVKFAHKLDAPACIDLMDQKVSIEEQKVSIDAVCKGKHKEFKLELELFEEVNSENSSWSMASVGRGTFTLQKKFADHRWARLLAGKEQPRNMHTWWRLHEKYADEIAKLGTERKRQNEEENEGEKVQEQAKEEEEEEEEEEVGAVDPKEAALEEKRLNLKKQAKKDEKRVQKEGKKEIKAIDMKLKGKLKEIEGKLSKEKKEAESDAQKDKEAADKATKEKIERIQRVLQESLGKIESEPTFYGRMTSLIFGNGKEEEEL